MDKKEILEIISSLKIDKEEFYILSTSALILRGIYNKANDIDISVTDAGLNQLMNSYNLKKKNNGFYEVNEKVECICDGAKEDRKYNPELINGYYVQNIYEYLEYLENTKRKKDKEKYLLVKKYVNSKENID